MAQITLEIPQKVAKRLVGKTLVSYEEIISDYENSFEFETVNMKASEFKKLLVAELSHD